MPRDGSGIYSIPPGTQGAPDTTIESAKYNAYIADVETDLNAPRPIIAGGTGGNSPATARDNIDAERAMQVVTNYDSMVWEAGSFFSAIGATSAPVAGHAFAGIVYGSDQNNLVLEARDLSDTNTPGLLYVREKAAGVWGAWFADVDTTIVNSKVAKAGDTMTGNLLIQKSGPGLNLSKAAAGEFCSITGALTGQGLRWSIELGNNAAESGANGGSNFGVSRYTDPGAFIDSPLTIDRATGVVTGNGLLSYAQAQVLTAAQQEQARKTIYAAPFDALAYNGMQINGSLTVDQVYVGGAIGMPTSGSVYTADGWVAQFAHASAQFQVQQMANAALPGFPNMLMFRANTGGNIGAAATDTAILQTRFEGTRFARCGFGKANAMPVSVGFWLLSAAPGTLGVALLSGNADRVYVNTVNVNVGNWEYKTVTFPPCFDGTWTNGTGLAAQLIFSSACGTNFQTPPNVWQTVASGAKLSAPAVTNFFSVNGNAIYITGVTVVPGNEVPSAARSPFIMRTFEEDLDLALRYYEKSNNYDLPSLTGVSLSMSFTAVSTVTLYTAVGFKKLKRVNPTMQVYSFNSGGSPVVGKLTDATGGNVDTPSTFTFPWGVMQTGFARMDSSGLITGHIYFGGWTADARL
jgi:hypothetical protein